MLPRSVFSHSWIRVLCSFVVAFFSSSFLSYCPFTAKSHPQLLAKHLLKYQWWGFYRTSQLGLMCSSYLCSPHNSLILCGHAGVLLQLFSSTAEELVCLLVRSVEKVLKGWALLQMWAVQHKQKYCVALILATSCQLGVGLKTKWMCALKSEGAGQKYGGNTGVGVSLLETVM